MIPEVCIQCVTLEEFPIFTAEWPVFTLCICDAACSIKKMEARKHVCSLMWGGGDIFILSTRKRVQHENAVI